MYIFKLNKSFGFIEDIPTRRIPMQCIFCHVYQSIRVLLNYTIVDYNNIIPLHISDVLRDREGAHSPFF